MKLSIYLLLLEALSFISCTAVKRAILPKYVKSLFENNEEIYGPLQKYLLLGHFNHQMLKNRKQYQDRLTLERYKTMKKKALNDVKIRLAFIDETIYDGLKIQSTWTDSCQNPCSVEKIKFTNDLTPSQIVPSYSDSSKLKDQQPHVVISSNWINTPFVAAIQSSDRLRFNHTSPDFTLKQAYAVVNTKGIDSFPLHEDLGKVDLLISSHRFSDVRVLPERSTNALEAAESLPRASKFPLKIFIESYDKESFPLMCDFNLPWYKSYLNALSNYIHMESNDESCMEKDPQFRLSEQHKIRLVFQNSLTPDFIPPGLVNYLESKQSSNELIIYFGHPSIRDYFDEAGSLEHSEGWMVVTFPCKIYATTLNIKLEGNAAAYCKFDLPSSRVLSILDFPGGVEQLADYLLYVSGDEKAFERHFGHRNVPDKQVSFLDDKKGENWLCQVCDTFRKKYYYEKESQ